MRDAAEALLLSPEDLTLKMAELNKTKTVESWVGCLVCQKREMVDAVKVLDAALARTFLVLERLGYSPDNPPA
jgi:aminoglycoside/choline kinase family phosphotransferase